ncbi:MAG: hypothetical protein ACI8XM_000925, partial [Haloarculaceae archaeon]
TGYLAGKRRRVLDERATVSAWYTPDRDYRLFGR